MIRMTHNPINNGAIIRVVEPVTETLIATIYASPKEDVVPGRVSWEASNNIHSDYIEEIEQAFHEAYRVTRGDLSINYN